LHGLVVHRLGADEVRTADASVLLLGVSIR
jgi:hypothetical protein